MKFEKVVFQSHHYYQLLALRDQVLRNPLGLFFSEEDLAQDRFHHHFAIINDSRVIATAQMARSNDLQYKMRQVAVNPKYQGMGIGKALVHEIENWSVFNGINEIILHARETAVPFYSKLNYSIDNQSFIEVGLTHFKMYKRISS